MAWIINNDGPYTIQLLYNGILTGYSTNGNNLIIESIMMNDNRNGSEYRCVILEQATATILDESNPVILFVTGEYQYFIATVQYYVILCTCAHMYICMHNIIFHGS